MTHAVIDAHIHIDWYEKKIQRNIINYLKKHNVTGLISVSSDLCSSMENLRLAANHPAIYPAVGYHPEQKLPSEDELHRILKLLDKQHKHIIAIGEVGLPYYTRQHRTNLPLQHYVRTLETFMRKAVEIDKPLILHAVYEDADLVCDLLEKHGITKAHFHWFKGTRPTMNRMMKRGYMISITPDSLFKEKIQSIIQYYPLELMMVETDGPYPFKENEITHPRMIHDSVKKISEMKQKDLGEVYQILFQNTKDFYQLP
ncbi:TatD family hydrolase [Halobacillus sp. A1]|uniref:TatD family hydrolase n=1 Tax=Halobacillus sp. A1 TaxID=2880262 RepID=UPI0020A621FB|nr:TatD family hydrolase [Halobacillus sp. A1]MCP3030089.1 TatD family hydrolase [Halobacillus sp. A1]